MSDAHPYGPSAERILQLGVIAYAVADPAEALIFIRAVGPRGLHLRQLVHPDGRDEFDAILAAVRARAVSDFAGWLTKFHVPEHEWRQALLAIEDIAQRVMPTLESKLSLLSTSLETVSHVVDGMYAGDELMQDIIARDIGAALLRTAFRSAEHYSDALKGLELTLNVKP